jgi:hypothetical protein
MTVPALQLALQPAPAGPARGFDSSLHAAVIRALDNSLIRSLDCVIDYVLDRPACALLSESLGPGRLE